MANVETGSVAGRDERIHHDLGLIEQSMLEGIPLQ